MSIGTCLVTGFPSLVKNLASIAFSTYWMIVRYTSWHVQNAYVVVSCWAFARVIWYCAALGATLSTPGWMGTNKGVIEANVHTLQVKWEYVCSRTRLHLAYTVRILCLPWYGASCCGVHQTLVRHLSRWVFDAQSRTLLRLFYPLLCLLLFVFVTSIYLAFGFLWGLFFIVRLREIYVDVLLFT